MLTREAFNALLKTLEEPPAHVIFIFATTETHKVPATILSRCQCYDFRRISLAEIAANLGKVAAAEGIEISPTALIWIAEAGDGSMRDGQSIFDQVISYAGMKIADTDVEEILGLVDRKYLFVLSEAVLQRDAGRCLTILEEAYLAGIDMKHFYQMMLKHFRNMLLVKIAADGSSSFDIAPEQIEKLKNQVQSVSRETLQRYLEILIKEEDSFRRSQEARMKLETVLVGLAYLEPIIPLGEIISTIEALEQKLSKGLPATVASIASQPSAIKAIKEIPANYGTEINVAAEKNNEESLIKPNKPTGDPATLGDDLKKFIKKESAILGAKMEAAEILNYENGLLTLGFPKGYIFLENISEKTQKEQIEQIAGNFFQENVTLKIQINENQKVNVNGTNGRGKANSINDIKHEAMSNPILQKVLDQFSDARIVEIKLLADQKQGG
jgi:DNA polymerase-3 subunit gamma/tau